MPEQVKNALISPSCTLASAVTAGVSTSFDVSDATNLPASGTFRLTIKGAASDGSADAVAVVGAITGVACSSVTWETVGSQTDFAIGAQCDLSHTAGAVAALLATKADTADSRFPTADEKAAMGVADSPSGSNGFVTQNALNLKADTADLPWTMARDFGAVGDGVADDTAALQAAIDAVSTRGGVVCLAQGTYMISSALMLASGVTIVGGGAFYGYNSTPKWTTRIKAATSFSSDYMIDTPASSVSNCGIERVDIVGNNDAVTNTHGGIRFRNVSWGAIRTSNICNMADEAILVDGGLAVTIENVLAVGCLLTRTRAVASGVIDVAGTDHRLSGIEATASLTGITDSNLYCAAFAIRMANGFVNNCVGEISDIGFRVTGANNRFTGSRADLNWGHGLVIAAAGNLFAACASLGNGRQTANTYSAFQNSGGSVFTGCYVYNASGTVKYGFEDTVNTSAVSSRGHYLGCVVSNGSAATSDYSVVDYLGSGVVFTPAAIRPTSGTTINVSQTSLVVLTGYSAATTVTNFTNGVSGQTIRIVGDADITLENNATIQTNTGANKTLVGGLIYEFTLYQGKWRERA